MKSKYHDIATELVKITNESENNYDAVDDIVDYLESLDKQKEKVTENVAKVNYNPRLG